RSPNGMLRLMRISLNTVQGVIPALRPRLPSRETRLPLKSAMQGSWKTPVGEYFEFTGKFPSAVHAGLANVFGREVNDDNCRLSWLPVMMLNGRPAPNSIKGANVQSLSNFPATPSYPKTFPTWYTPLNTKRWRWSNKDVERSRNGK